MGTPRSVQRLHLRFGEEPRARQLEEPGRLREAVRPGRAVGEEETGRVVGAPSAHVAEGGRRPAAVKRGEEPAHRLRARVGDEDKPRHRGREEGLAHGIRSLMRRLGRGARGAEPRVPITRPSSGVNPIDVSTDCPARMAAAEQPAPRWRATSVARSGGVPVISA